MSPFTILPRMPDTFAGDNSLTGQAPARLSGRGMILYYQPPESGA